MTKDERMEVTNTFGPVDIAISGMRAHGKSVEVIHSNVANIRTTDAGKGQPYRRLEAKLKADEEGVSGVSLDKITEDKADFLKILDPGNPDADENGYVNMPNIDLATEMISLDMATRAYQANAAILKRYQKMVETTLELLR
jgi:flagellar basal-body rod protein FlgC